MNKTTYIISFLIFLLALSACDDRKTYSELQKEEENTIKAYILRNNITVVKEMPTTWAPNIYYETPSGLYIHISDEGDTAKSLDLTSMTKVVIRTVEYELDEKNTIISSKMYPGEYLYPDEFIYGNPSSAPNMGIYEAVGIMKNEGSKATIIVPSSLNVESYSNILKAVRYDIVMNFPVY